MTAHPARQTLVTFDLFSALINSRAGGTKFFRELSVTRGWPVDGELVYDQWDQRNKASQKTRPEWVPFAEHSRRALRATYRQLDLGRDADLDINALLTDIANWPLWPDVAEGLPILAAETTIGVLSNVDDDIYALTRVAPLIGNKTLFSSERFQAYKPARLIYERASSAAKPRELIHVASSARDVRGALEAGINTIRLDRNGHSLDPDGPVPSEEAESIFQVAGLIETRP